MQWLIRFTPCVLASAGNGREGRLHEAMVGGFGTGIAGKRLEILCQADGLSDLIFRYTGAGRLLAEQASDIPIMLAPWHAS